MINQAQKFKERTIYNGLKHNDRTWKIKPNLGKTLVTGSKSIKRSFGNLIQTFESTVEKSLKHQRDESIWKINSITQKQSQLLFSARTVFPFDFFPDEITISSTKIEVKLHSFFFTYSTTTIPLQDIGHVELYVGLLFASLNIVNIRSDEPIRINFLWADEAQKAKRIINGLLIAQEAGVDVCFVEPKDLLPQLEGLGA